MIFIPFKTRHLPVIELFQTLSSYYSLKRLIFLKWLRGNIVLGMHPLHWPFEVGIPTSPLSQPLHWPGRSSQFFEAIGWRPCHPLVHPSPNKVSLFFPSAQITLYFCPFKPCISHPLLHLPLSPNSLYILRELHCLNYPLLIHFSRPLFAFPSPLSIPASSVLPTYFLYLFPAWCSRASSSFICAHRFFIFFLVPVFSNF